MTAITGTTELARSSHPVLNHEEVAAYGDLFFGFRYSFCVLFRLYAATGTVEKNVYGKWNCVYPWQTVLSHTASTAQHERFPSPYPTLLPIPLVSSACRKSRAAIGYRDSDS